MPTRTPWERNSCQICVVKEAAMKPPERHRTPAPRVSLKCQRRQVYVATGAMSMAIEKLRPPMKAYLIEVPPGKTSLSR